MADSARGPAFSVDVKGSFQGNKNPTTLPFKILYTHENNVMTIIFNFWQYYISCMPTNPTHRNLK